MSKGMAWRKVMHRQGRHVLAFVLLGILVAVAARDLGGDARGLLGWSAATWVAISWVFAGLSQFWVAGMWRLELHGGRVSGCLGDGGFGLHRLGYVLLFAGRFLPFVPIAVLTRGTSPLAPSLSLALLVSTAPLILWTGYSAVVHMGLDRLAGADHFDPAYREGGKVTGGIYAWLPNPAYTVGILILFHPGLLWQSGLALVVASAHWVFVWVHYHCTEAPDLRTIYGQS